MGQMKAECETEKRREGKQTGMWSEWGRDDKRRKEAEEGRR